MKTALVIVINYANEEEVISYAKMLSQQNDPNNLNLVIVNNKKSVNTNIDLLEEIEKIGISIDLFEPSNNLGYLNGALFGYREFINKRGFTPNWAVVSNTDIEISDLNFFNKLLTTEYNEDIWCIAPSVYAPHTRSYQNPQYKNRHTLNKLNRVIFINEIPFLAYMYSLLSKVKGRIKQSSKEESQYVYSAHGCFFALKDRFIEKIKDYDYKGFLYSEEAYIAEHLRKQNKKCFYDSNLDLVHNEHAVTGLLSVKKRSEYIANSLKYIRKEFY